MVVDEAFIRLFVTKILERIRPEKIAHNARGRRLPKSINLMAVLHRVTYQISLTGYMRTRN